MMDQTSKIALRAKRLRLCWLLFFWRQARKIVMGVIGITVLLIGIAGLVLPVLPGWVLIFVGLGILATEFAWARWVLKVAKERIAKVMEQVTAASGSPSEATPPDVPLPQACSTHPKPSS